MIPGMLSVLLVLTCAVAAFGEIPDSDCLDCHSDEELTDDTGRSLWVVADSLNASVHEGFACTDCHTGIAELPHEEKLPGVACAACHEEAQDGYANGVHGKALLNGDEDAPSCSDCHGSHTVRPASDQRSRMHPRNQAETCAVCHADPKIVARHPFTVQGPVDAYKKSAHFGALVERGVAPAPSCSDCHGSHDLKPSRDPGSPIHWTRVAETCGKCHAGILSAYAQSVHGKAVERGERQAPTCTDCHGEHEIRGSQDPESTVHPAHISKTTCVWCHESVRVVKKFGLESGRLGTYKDSYHGLADRAGSGGVANCASCHGIHDILPSTDQRSSIHTSNLPETCGKCHPGVDESVALGLVHVDPTADSDSSPIVYFVRQFYIMLILSTVGGMLVHNALDLSRKFRSGRLPDGNDYLRFTLCERLQHATMALSFIVLAYSGFALKFPEAWWAAPFAWIDGGEASRRLVHRIAAVAMVAVCLFHIGYALGSRRGRKQLVDMLPRLQDVRDAVQMIRYYLRLSHSHPAFGQFSYMEKAEYWALVWGSVVMTVTGFSLWFANISLRLLPKWMLDVATVIHYYEAWLAVLAIIVWHFYFVIFNPRFYPMSLVWLTGRLSREAMAEEHPLAMDSEDNRE